MKILFTGASSFTGYWFVKALAQAGHEVVCPLRGKPEQYEGVRRRRADELKGLCRLLPNAPFGSDAFKTILTDGEWDLLCHHAADVTNYKSPDFDIYQALLNNTFDLRKVLCALKQHGGKGVVLTGSVFENDEGAGEGQLRAFSPYGLSKGLTWQVWRYFCAEADLRVGKFVIPNPFGPLEDPRFTAYLMKTWKEKKAAAVKTPDYVRDNIHADLLAAAYRDFVEKVTVERKDELRESATSRISEHPAQAHSKVEPAVLRLNPSGYIESQGAFALRIAREVRARTTWSCEVELAEQKDFSEPLVRTNSDPAASLVEAWSEQEAWDQFVGYYCKE